MRKRRWYTRTGAALLIGILTVNNGGMHLIANADVAQNYGTSGTLSADNSDTGNKNGDVRDGSSSSSAVNVSGSGGVRQYRRLRQFRQLR